MRAVLTWKYSTSLFLSQAVTHLLSTFYWDTYSVTAFHWGMSLETFVSTMRHKQTKLLCRPCVLTTCMWQHLFVSSMVFSTYKSSWKKCNIKNYFKSGYFQILFHEKSIFWKSYPQKNENIYLHEISKISANIPVWYVFHWHFA